MHFHPSKNFQKGWIFTVSTFTELERYDDDNISSKHPVEKPDKINKDALGLYRTVLAPIKRLSGLIHVPVECIMIF